MTQTNIDNIANLDQLLAYLADLSDDENDRVDWASLPTFGGPDVDDTDGVWSWDATRMLVGTCRDDLEIIPREDVVLTAQIAGRDNGLAEASVLWGGERIGSVSLADDREGGLTTWGDSIDCWADAGVQRWIDSRGDRHEAIQDVVDAVDAAAEGGE